MYANCILVILNASHVFPNNTGSWEVRVRRAFHTGEPGTDLEGGDIFTTTRLCYRIRIVVVLGEIAVFIDLDIP